MNWKYGEILYKNFKMKLNLNSRNYFFIWHWNELHICRVNRNTCRYWCVLTIQCFANESTFSTYTITKQALRHSAKQCIKRKIEIDTVLTICIAKIICCEHILIVVFCVCQFGFFDCINSYPAVAWAEELYALPSWAFGVKGGTGDPPDSSDGVFDKNKLPPSSETSVIGELYGFQRKNREIILCVEIII